MTLKDAGILFENVKEYTFPEEAEGALVILYSMRDSKYIRTMAGHCGDVPVYIHNQILKLLIDAGENTADDKQTLCINALYELYLARTQSYEKMKESFQKNKDVFGMFFKMEKAEEVVTTGIECTCGFGVPGIVQMLLDHIAGKNVKIRKAFFNCLASFRHAEGNDWERIGAMKGIMLGIVSYIEKKALPSDKEMFGYAKRTLDYLSGSKADKNVILFLAALFFTALHAMYTKLENRFQDVLPEHLKAVPGLHYTEIGNSV
jgi:hypothetical protein